MAYGLTGQIKPHLEGVWKMDRARSEFPSGPVSDSRMDRITINGMSLKDTITQKLHGHAESTYDMNYTLDGKDSFNEVNGRKVKANAYWEGNDLVIESTVYAIRNTQILDRWSLSADAKTIVLKREMRGAVNADQKVFLERQ